MEVIKAEPVDNLILDDTLYQFNVELMEIEKVMISVFNTYTGLTYKTYINKTDEWFESNIYIFQGDFSKFLTILRDSLINNKNTLPHKEVEEKDILRITINYADDIYPFELKIDVKKYVSKNGEIDDRINSLEYQVRVLKTMLYETNYKPKPKPLILKGAIMKTMVGIMLMGILYDCVQDSTNNKIYNEAGNLIYEGGIKDGKRHGKGIEYCPNNGNKLIDATFKMDIIMEKLLNMFMVGQLKEKYNTDVNIRMVRNMVLKLLMDGIKIGVYIRQRSHLMRMI